MARQVRTRPGGPIIQRAAGAARRALRQRAAGRPYLAGELAVVVFLLLVYDQVANLASVRATTAVAHAEDLLRVERWLHLSFERDVDLLVAAHHGLSSALALYYDLAHGIVTVGVLVLVYICAPTVYRRTRWALVGTNLVALVIFIVLPVAPPRLLPGGGFVDVVARSGTWAAWQTGSAVAHHADEYASLPSLHIAWAGWVLLAVLAATTSRTLRLLAVGHVVVTIVVVLATGNHYVLDVLSGAVLAAGCWIAAARLGRRGSGAAAADRYPALKADRVRL